MRFPSENASNVFRPNYAGGIFKTTTITGHFGFVFEENSIIRPRKSHDFIVRLSFTKRTSFDHTKIDHIGHVVLSGTPEHRTPEHRNITEHSGTPEKPGTPQKTRNTRKKTRNIPKKTRNTPKKTRNTPQKPGTPARKPGTPPRKPGTPQKNRKSAKKLKNEENAK